MRPGDKAPNFQLPSAQGGLFRLETRATHGPVLLAFVGEHLSLRLPLYVLRDDRGMVSVRYDVGEAEVAAALVGDGGKLTWRSEPDHSRMRGDPAENPTGTGISRPGRQNQGLSGARGRLE